MTEKIVLAFFLLMGFGITSYAEDQACYDEWNPPSAGPITTWTAPLCGKGKLIIQPLFYYNKTRGTFDAKGHYHALLNSDTPYQYKYQYQEQLFAQYGLTDKLEIDGQITYQENYAKQDGTSAHMSGLGDSYLYARYCLYEEKGWVPHIAGLFQLKAPTGKYQHEDSDKLGTDLMGTGSWNQGIGFILTKHIKPFILHADAIYSFSQPVKVNGLKTRYGNYLNLDFAAEYFLPKGFNLLFEANGYRQGDTKQDGVKNSHSNVNYLILSPGIGWSNEKIQCLIAYQRIVLGTNTDANDSMVATCIYTF